MKYTLLIISICVSISLRAQSSASEETFRPTNNLYLDLFGGGSIFSVNYEKVFLSKKNSFLNFRIGAGYTQDKSDAILGITEKEFNAGIGVFHYTKTNDYSAPTSHFSIPTHLSVNLGRDKHYFEVGLHYTYYLPVKSVVHTFGPILGYRYHPFKSDKAIFRFYINFPLEGIGEIHWYSPVGISFGFSA
jgi:hypothetical protein